MASVWTAPARRRVRLVVGTRIAAGALAAGTAPLVAGAWRTSPGWVAVNAVGRPVGLAEGPAFVAASLAGAAVGAPSVLPSLVLLQVPVVVAGRIDDLHGSARDRGVRGHLGALRAGRVTSGQLKAVVVVVAGLRRRRAAVAGPASRRSRHRLAAGRRRSRSSPRRVDTLLAGGLIATSANLVNLLDVVPGRALKAVLGASLAGAVAAAADGPTGVVLAAGAGAAVGLLPADLAEKTMLGDAGSNVAGALVGWGLTRARGRRHRLAVFGALAAATALSEAVSLSRLVAAVPVLDRLDRLGRRR